MSRWQRAPIGEVATIVSGATPKTGVATYWDGGVPWATPRDLSRLQGPTIDTTERTLSAAGLAACAASMLPAGSVLLSSRAPIGHVAINTVPMATNQGFKSLVPHEGVLDAKYAYHWLKSSRSTLEALGNGATFKELSMSTLSRIEMPLPPIEEQRRIAAILDQADALQAKSRAAIARVALAQRSLQRSAESTGDVSLHRISDVADVQTGPFGSLLHQTDYVADGIPIVNPMHIVDGRIVADPRHAVTHETWSRLASYQLRVGDVVLARRGEMGRAALVTSREAGFLCGTGSLIIRPHRDAVEPVYLCAALSTTTARDRLLRVSLGSTLPNLNSRIIEDFQLALPSRSVQSEFVQAMGRLDLLKGAMESSVSLLEELRSSLEYRAFKGEL